MEVLGGLDGLVLETILLKIGPKSAAGLACTSTRLRGAASADAIWRPFCADDFDLSEPVDPDGKPLPSFKETYVAWFESFKKYPVPVVKRAKTFWTSMKNWLATNFPEALETLNKGVSENKLDSFESTLGFKLPIPTRVLYRFCNGQNTKAGTKGSSEVFTFGLIGGYEFYSHFVNVHLLPLNEVLLLTKRLSRDLDCLAGPKLVITASSFNWRKLFFHDCESGQLYVGTQNLVTDSEMLPCVPQSLVGEDGYLVWLEEHLRRLQSGIIGIRVLRGFKSISLYPEAPPLCSTAVTNGVKVRASAVLVPEGSTPGEQGEDPGDRPDRYLYTYSIRLSMLPEGCMLDGKYYSSCQLSSRHWLIRSRGILVSDVSGEGVIGKYPLLTPGMDEFVYESAASLFATPGSMEGSFTIIPGRLSKAEGRQFEARVAPFALEDLHFIF